MNFFKSILYSIFLLSMTHCYAQQETAQADYTKKVAASAPFDSKRKQFKCIHNFPIGSAEHQSGLRGFERGLFEPKGRVPEPP